MINSATFRPKLVPNRKVFTARVGINASKSHGDESPPADNVSGMMDGNEHEIAA